MIDTSRIEEIKNRVEAAKIKYGIPKKSECEDEIYIVFGVLAKAMYYLGLKEFSLRFNDSKKIKVIGAPIA